MSDVSNMEEIILKQTRSLTPGSLCRLRNGRLVEFKNFFDKDGKPTKDNEKKCYLVFWTSIQGNADYWEMNGKFSKLSKEHEFDIVHIIFYAAP